MKTAQDLKISQGGLDGILSTDPAMRQIYATDASVYEELPRAVAWPRDENDIKALITLAKENEVGLIPRTAGTSLAGQVVGNGIVVDLSRHMTRILEIDAENRTFLVEPGVIRNELNMELANAGLFFGPETSTQNRAMIGGMLGNNSCGSNSIVYGSVRDQVVEVEGFLSDGSYVTLGDLDAAEFSVKCALPGLEGDIHRCLQTILGDSSNRQHLADQSPHPDIPRRNTGYALDLMADTEPFTGDTSKPLNLSRLIAGSEGTLMLATRIRLRCDPLPPPHVALVCAHFTSIDEALQANLISLQATPYACELMDHHILEGTERNLEFRRYRFFIEGNPMALLVTELRDDDADNLDERVAALQSAFKEAGLGYAYPVVRGADCAKVWELRNAGLGLLSNIPGDAKPVPVIEDTAVRPAELPVYIAELTNHLKEAYGIECVHYAHAGSGELHLRPVLDLKTEEGNRLFRQVLEDTAGIVRKYRGSLSGEHGDGRLRGEFIQSMVGERVYGWMCAVKKAWDPDNLFNPGKIIDVPPMNTSLRYTPGQETKDYQTWFRWDSTQGFLRAAEMCNGTAACRKTHLSGGTMCPSYMATRDEKDSTRARANRLRFVLTHGSGTDPFKDEGLKQVMDLCLSCKGCKSECPSNVDVARMKAEVLQQRYDLEGIPLRSRMIGHYADLLKLSAPFAPAWNALFREKDSGNWIKRLLGFAPGRSMPHIASSDERRAFSVPREVKTSSRTVYLFRDEFTRFLDAHIGNQAIQLLERLGYQPVLIEHPESGRSAFSKGMLKRAKGFAEANVRTFASLVSENEPLVGIEPSAILGFRDEYPDLVDASLKADADKLAPNCLTIEEFLWREMQAGRIKEDSFTEEKARLLVHGHCHAKALSGMEALMGVMNFPRQYMAEAIPSGCCGMAGSFGYEKEHFELSQRVGELVLFPAVREVEEATILVAPGTSCRHQIHDGTGRTALHPVEVLLKALA
ncbi:MAG: FAD-binding and (Fe-S)-binding domain-containing protein [Puniceicoccaceae bacterium]